MNPAYLVALDARDERVFDAVRELLAQQGIQMSMDAVAQHAGCSKQTLYSRYGSKQQLLRRVISATSATPPGPWFVHSAVTTCVPACSSSPPTSWSISTNRT